MARRFFINLDAPIPSQGFVESFAQNIPVVNLTQFARSDSFPIELVFLRESQDETAVLPFYYVDPSGFSSVKFGGGVIGATPDSGTFTLTDTAGSQTTAAIAYNASAATVQTAIRAALTTNFSAATVTGDAGGPWSIDRGTTGALADITGSAAALSPDGSTVVIVNAQNGSATLNEKWQVTLAKALPILIASGWTALPSPSVSTTVVQAGSATVNKTFRVTWNADAYGGAVTLLFTGDTTTATITPISYSASANDVATAFASHVDVADAANISVIKNGPGDYTVACVGTGIKLSNTPALAESNNTLQVPTGLTAVCTVSTAGADAILGNEDSANITLEVEVRQSSGQPNTAAQATTKLLKDLISNTPGQQTGTEDWVSSGDLKQDNTLFVDLVYGNNATATREFLSLPYASPLTASAAASSGDLIVFRPASFTVSENMGADGVNWYFPAGTTVSASGDLESGIFDDSANGLNAPFSFTVDGAGVISYESTGETTPLVHAINITNASSEVVIRCKKVIGDTNDDGSDSSGAVAVFDGSLELTCEEVLSTGKGYCVYWENGDLSVKAHKLIGTQNAAISSNIQSTPTGKFWVEALDVTSSASSVITTAGNQTTARVWINAQEIYAASGFKAVDIQGSEKIYITAQKISNSGAESAVFMSSGELWLRVDKITADDTMLELTGGTSWIDLQELEVGSATAAYCIVCSGGTHVIKGARFTGGASSLGINVTGGTLTLIDCYINTAANASARPITKSGGTLILQNCALVAEATQDSIEASTAQNVKVYGTSVANKAKDANVTIQVGTLTVSTDVV